MALIVKADTIGYPRAMVCKFSADLKGDVRSNLSCLSACTSTTDPEDDLQRKLCTVGNDELSISATRTPTEGHAAYP